MRRWADAWGGLLVIAGWLLGTAGPVRPAYAEAGTTVPVKVFVAQLARAQQTASQCEHSPAGCDAEWLPGRERVTGSGSGGVFTADWDWFRDEVNLSKTSSPSDRGRHMRDTQAHLAELVREVALPGPVNAAQFSRARAAANRTLAREEFRGSAGPDWWERQAAKIQTWILNLFSGMDRLGKRAPWLAPMVEWGCFALAAAGLLWFVRQSLARQELRPSLGQGATPAMSNSEAQRADWARLAEERAAGEDWREAIHCLYWAAIALLERRRAWRPNATRTPREYLGLLPPGSETSHALHRLTRVFETVWYGQGRADGEQFRSALAHFRAIEVTRPERAGIGSTSLTAGEA